MSVSSLPFESGMGSSLFGLALSPKTMLEYAVYVGAIMLVTAIMVLWLATGRESGKPLETDARRRSSRGRVIKWLGWGGTGKSGSKRRRRLKRRRNPTLAETGGLPPIREEGSSSAERYQN